MKERMLLAFYTVMFAACLVGLFFMASDKTATGFGLMAVGVAGTFWIDSVRHK